MCHKFGSKKINYSIKTSWTHLQSVVAEAIEIRSWEEVKRVLWRHCNFTIVDVAQEAVKSFPRRNHFSNRYLSMTEQESKKMLGTLTRGTSGKQDLECPQTTQTCERVERNSCIQKKLSTLTQFIQHVLHLCMSSYIMHVMQSHWCLAHRHSAQWQSSTISAMWGENNYVHFHAN